jgi:hypothetical protein
MYRWVTHTRRFDTDNRSDLEEYDKVLSNPLCTVIDSKREKITDREMGEEGRIISMNDRIVMVVTWKEKTLL